MKTTKTMRLARILAVAMVICLMASMMLCGFAFADTEDAIETCKDGVLQVKLKYSPDTGEARDIGAGTGFLINDDTLLTCYHVIHVEEDDLNARAELEGKTPAEYESRISIAVTVARDVFIPATVINESYEMDFAILRLSQPLTGKAALPIRSSDTVRQGESVFTIGFPELPQWLQTYSTFTRDDTTVTTGTVNKIAIGVNLFSVANTEYIESNCNLSSGNSGGPMCDAEGNVIGISQSVVWEDDESRSESYHAITIDQVTEVLDPLGIQYTKADDVPAPTDPVVDPTDPVADPTEPPATEPVTEAPTLPTLTTDAIPTPGNDGGEGGNALLWIIIGVVAFIIIVIVVVVIIIIATSGKKKTPPTGGNGTFTAPPPPVRPVTPPTPGGFAPSPTVPAQGAGETTVLGGGAGETTVLSRNAVNGGTLIRKRNGESISINAEQFVIGRERKSVNYCIADNSSISRTHVRLTVRNGVTYLTDLNAANGTFVNGVKAMPRQEVALKNGDKITLADEDLEYKI